MKEINEKFKKFIIKENDLLIEKLSSYIYNFIKSWFINLSSFIKL